MPKLIRPPDKADVTLFLRMLFLRTERNIVNEITRKRTLGYVDYAEVAALERIQRVLKAMVDESWSYVPVMIEKIFYQTESGTAGYQNARALTATEISVIEQLSNNLLGELEEAAETAEKTARKLLIVGRPEEGLIRKETLYQVAKQQAAGTSWKNGSGELIQKLQNKGVTAFVDRTGREWSLQDYCNMATRTTARQAQVAAILTKNPNHDLYQIVKIGSTCPVCAPLEGRVYSKSGTNPDYPALTLAFGKMDPNGPDDILNTYLNIHPNCLHSIIPYTTIGKTEKQIQKDKDFSNPEKNPLNRDPRTKKQIAAYREKEKNRRRLLADKKQHKEYRTILGNEVPKDFADFQELKYNDNEKWNILKKTKRAFSEIDRKNWNDEFKLKSKQAFKHFKDNGIILSSHALGRLPRLNQKKFPPINEDDLLSILRQAPNYCEGDDKKVYFSLDKQVAIIKNNTTGDIVSIVRRKAAKNDWTRIV